MKTIDEILNAEKCGDIFDRGSAKYITEQYRDMARMYHPDVCIDTKATHVMGKINRLYKEALKLTEDGLWEASNTISFLSTTGVHLTITYRKKFDFELGNEYVSNSHVVYVLKSQYERFFVNAKNQIERACFGEKSSQIMKEFYKYLPTATHFFKCTDGTFCIVLEKKKGIVPLRLLLDKYNGSIPDTHVAWMISRLCNLDCFFEHKKIAHNGFTIENLYVDPEMHSIHILGGWWYAKPIGEKLLGVPKFVYDVMPVKEKGEKISATRTDIETIKRTANVLLGSGTSPVPMMNFLNSGSSDNAIEEFSKWSKALEKSYGQRRFIRMDIEIDELYK